MRDVKRFFNDARNIIHVRDQITVLHNRQCDANDVRLLKRATANHILIHLACDSDERTGIHVSVGNSRDEVSRARAARAHANAGLAS